MLKQSNMAFDCHGRKKPLLYSDLFKCHKNMDTTQEKEDGNIMISGLEGSSWISGSTQSSSTSGSSSSGFSTPLFSDLESDDADFMDELTRQMAECMFQEEEEEEEEIDNTESGPAKNNRAIKNGFNSCPACVDDQIPPIQVYELKNQPPVSKQGNNICRGKVGKGQQPHKTQHNYMHCRGRKMGRNGHPVSGMQAVFLGGSGSTSGSPGTGVFFPRVTSDPTQLNKKMSGCSMVLMPTRVLQTLELHFNQCYNSKVPALSGGSDLTHKDESATSKGHLQSQLETNSDDMQLPQEWTY